MLDERIEESGYKKNAIARLLGITPASLNNKINNKTEFNVSEYMKIEKILNLTSDESRRIFFVSKVEGNSTGAING